MFSSNQQSALSAAAGEAAPGCRPLSDSTRTRTHTRLCTTALLHTHTTPCTLPAPTRVRAHAHPLDAHAAFPPTLSVDPPSPLHAPLCTLTPHTPVGTPPPHSQNAFLSPGHADAQFVGFSPCLGTPTPRAPTPRPTTHCVLPQNAAYSHLSGCPGGAGAWGSPTLAQHPTARHRNLGIAPSPGWPHRADGEKNPYISIVRPSSVQGYRVGSRLILPQISHRISLLCILFPIS